MTRDKLPFLTSDAGARLLADLAHADLSDANTLALLTRLRQSYDADHAAAALTLARLRQRATAKFGDDAHKLFFTPAALEQASDPQVRHYRAAIADGKRALDVCCSLGTDSIALARAGASSVLGLDNDPLRIEMAKCNAAALDLPIDFRVQDVTQGVPASYDLIFYDPARRDAGGRRLHAVEAYQPPLSLVNTWQADMLAVKLSPAVDLAQLADYGGLTEFISVAGDLKEAVLWLGRAEPGTLATRIADGQVMHWRRDHTPNVGLSAPRGWLLEPDPALLRAGLVQDVAEALQGWLLDETIAYITTDAQPDSAWVRAWQIWDWLPFNLKQLRAYLRERDIGRVTVKKRGFPMSPDELQAKLKLKPKRADKRCTLVLTRHAGTPIVLVCADFVPE